MAAGKGDKVMKKPFLKRIKSSIHRSSGRYSFLYSIRIRYTLLTVFAIVVALGISTLIGAVSIKRLGNQDADQMLSMMCKTGALNLESYFEGVEHSVTTVSTLVQNSLKDMPLEMLDSQVERSRNLFGEVAFNTNGVLTYYFRIDPEFSENVKGFWYVNLDGQGFREHSVTDISLYDTDDTSSLVWFTVPKATGKGVWLPPYITENLGVRVISYNVPVYWNDQFVGVIGIEMDYQTLAHEVENIRLFENGYAFLIDADANIIYHPQIDSPEVFEEESAQLQDVLRSDDHFVQYNHDGFRKEAVWLPLRNGMRLYVTVPVSEINKGWREMIWKCNFAFLILLVIVSYVFLHCTGRLTKPLHDLTEAAKQVSKGNYDFVMDYDRNDEIGILMRTFRQLIDTTKEHIGSLNQQVFVDALTSVRNKGGYDHYIREMQDQLDMQGEQMEFAIGVFDCDNLKIINDNYGHDKGDIYLKSSSHLICHIFQHSPVFRVGGDEFSVILQNKDYEDREELLGLFRKGEKELYEAGQNPWEQVRITYGLAVYDPTNDTSVNDVARRADQIMYENKRLRKKGQSLLSAEELAKGINISKYVAENVDKAIRNQWIKVYYQPVIRSLTGTLCGMESLVRWDDPELGFLLPKQFIGPLEKCRQIYKVDMYVVEHVCEDLHDRIANGKPVVPVSINCSRLDFTICNMLDVVEQAAERYGIPREYIHIEVTEGMIASDEALMRHVIDDFQKAGYEVWMDDFGSGFSSLTFLKDYHFNLLKMDMNFLSSLTDRSKKLLESIIIMAKELGIETLAEGVETREEVEYLKEIGCGKLQGYYYGQPQPVDDMFAQLDEAQIPVETWEESVFYEKASSYIKPTDVPLEIVEDDGVNFKTLYMNRAYMEQIFDDYPDLAEADRRIYQMPSPLLKKYREFADKLEKSGKEELFYYTGVYSYLRLQAQVLAEYNGRYLMQGSLINLSLESNKAKTEGFDIRLRELNQLFEAVHVVDIENDALTPLLGGYKFFDDNGPEKPGLCEQFAAIAEKRIRADERDAFIAFMDCNSLLSRVGKSERGYLSLVFHVKQDDGAYKPEEIALMPIPGSRGKEFLFCSKLV